MGGWKDIGKRLGGEGSKPENEWRGGQGRLVQTKHLREVGRLQWLKRGVRWTLPECFFSSAGGSWLTMGLTSANGHTI